MKNTVKSLAALLLIVLCITSFYACKDIESPETTASSSDADTTEQDGSSTESDLPELWENAVYTTDKEFGNGSKTITLEVTAGEKSVVFTVKTDKSTVGEALIEHGIITGEEGEFGIYIKTVNGILADYSIDQSYWSVYIGDEPAATGVDSIEITEGAEYKLVYTK